MTVLRKDPHQPEARQYLRMVIDIMRQNPAIAASKMGAPGGQAVALSPLVQEELRKMLQQRSLFAMDLKAIPGVQFSMKGNMDQVAIDTSLLFAENSGALKEQGVPLLDRVAAWLKTYGQQPVIVHCYPEELQEASTNGSLFLHRYSELFSFFVEERKLPPQRFVSADLLKTTNTPADVEVSSSAPKVVIETLASQSAALEAMPSAAPEHALSRWLELSIMTSRTLFNPEEGEWINFDVAALTRTGLRNWVFKIIPVEGKDPQPVLLVEGKGNLLKRLAWDGHHQKTGSFVPSGSYIARLVATDSDGTIMNRENALQVLRTTAPEPDLVEKPKPKVKVAKKPTAKRIQLAKAESKKVPSPLVGEAADGGADNAKANPPPTTSPTRGEDKNKGEESDSLIDAKQTAAVPSPTPTGGEGNKEETESQDTGDSVHAIWKQVIQFEPNQSELKPTVKASLERIGKTLEVYPLQKVRITGFAMRSELNSPDLAQQRAEAVRSILVDEYHVDKKRVIVAGGQTTTAENASKVEMSITN
jgi:outer membrane protein OmpA-like peptidoglycan-associated protein